MKKSFKSSAILQRKESVFFRVEQGYTVLILSFDDDNIYQLRGASAYLWLLLDGTRTVSEVAKLAKEDLEISGSDFGRKVETFITKLLSAELIEEISELQPAKRRLKKLDPRLFKSESPILKLLSFPEYELPAVYAKSTMTAG